MLREKLLELIGNILNQKFRFRGEMYNSAFPSEMNENSRRFEAAISRSFLLPSLAQTG